MRANGGALAIERPRDNMIFLKEMFEDDDFKYTEEDFKDAEMWFKRQNTGEKNIRVRTESRHAKRNAVDSAVSMSANTTNFTDTKETEPDIKETSFNAKEALAAAGENTFTTSETLNVTEDPTPVSTIERIEEVEVVSDPPSENVFFSPKRKDISLNWDDYYHDRDMLSRWLVPGEDNLVPGRYSLTIQSPHSVTTITRETTLYGNGFSGRVSPILTVPEYLEQLERLLSFMSFEDRNKNLKKYKDLLEASDNTFEMMEALGTPQMLAAKLTTDYEGRKPETEQKEEKTFRSVAASRHADDVEEKKETLLTMVVDMTEEEEASSALVHSESRKEKTEKTVTVAKVEPAEVQTENAGSAFLCILGICVCFFGILTLSVIELGGVLVLIKTFINLSSSMSYIDCVFTIGLFVVALSLGAFIIVCLLSCIRGLTGKLKTK